jgi:hypothetical protein
MAKSGRKNAGTPPRSVWNTTLDHIEGTEPTQAGEIPEGLEAGLGGGDKGLDAETGSGGYGGDAVEAGHDEAVGQPDRPADVEIHGDPRTPLGLPYPDESLRAELDQTSIGESPTVVDGDEEEPDVD